MKPKKNVQVLTELEKERVKFAQQVFSNIQDLIQFADQKSNILLAVIGLFSAALFTFSSNYLSSQKGMGQSIALVLIFWYLVHTGQAIWHAVLTAKALPNVLSNSSNAPEMIFPLMILSRYQESDANYLDALQQVDIRDIMADYSQQIMEISNIYRVKQFRVNKAIKQLLWSALPWFSLVVVITIDRLLPMSSPLKVYILLGASLVMTIPGWWIIRRA